MNRSFNDDQLVTTSDILKLGSVFGSSQAGVLSLLGLPYDVRYDLSGDGLITGSDVLRFGQYFGKSCT